MITKVIFELKSNIRAWSNQIIDFKAKGFNRILINIKDINCEVVVDGKNEKDNYDYLINIWELLTWQDGYFYKPICYEVDGENRDIKELLAINCRTTDKKWISSAMLLCRNNRQISEELIEKYKSNLYHSWLFDLKKKKK